MKYILKKPFEDLMNRAIQELKKYEHNSEEEALNQLKQIMIIMINDFIDIKYKEMRERGDISDKKLEKRFSKIKMTSMKLLEDKLKEMKKDREIFKL